MCRRIREHITHLRFLYTYLILYCYLCFFFFFNDTATTEIYTLSLHDALPIFMEKTDHVLIAGEAARELALANGLTRSNLRVRSEEHTSELQSPCNLVCRLLLEKKKNNLETNSAHITPPLTITYHPTSSLVPHI